MWSSIHKFWYSWGSWNVNRLVRFSFSWISLWLPTRAVFFARFPSIHRRFFNEISQIRNLLFYVITLQASLETTTDDERNSNNFNKQKKNCECVALADYLADSFVLSSMIAQLNIGKPDRNGRCDRRDLEPPKKGSFLARGWYIIGMGERVQERSIKLSIASLPVGF